MPLNVVKVAQAVQGGLSTVCATCTKYWEGRDLGLPGDRCTAKSPCGSPLAGGDFHEYVGPMTSFDQFCFVCGEDVVALINKRGSVRRFGLCAKHKQMVANLKPVNMARPFEQPLVVNGDGQVRALDKLLPPRKPTVFERIEATEEEFRKRDIERGLLPEPE
jgi:hypothetical protein